jgi:hypothetical protein
MNATLKTSGDSNRQYDLTFTLHEREQPITLAGQVMARHGSPNDSLVHNNKDQTLKKKS